MQSICRGLETLKQQNPLQRWASRGPTPYGQVAAIRKDAGARCLRVSNRLPSQIPGEISIRSIPLGERPALLRRCLRRSLPLCAEVQQGNGLACQSGRKRRSASFVGRLRRIRRQERRGNSLQTAKLTVLYSMNILKEMSIRLHHGHHHHHAQSVLAAMSGRTK